MVVMMMEATRLTLGMMVVMITTFGTMVVEMLVTVMTLGMILVVVVMMLAATMAATVMILGVTAATMTAAIIMLVRMVEAMHGDELVVNGGGSTHLVHGEDDQQEIMMPPHHGMNHAINHVSRMPGMAPAAQTQPPSQQLQLCRMPVNFTGIDPAAFQVAPSITVGTHSIHTVVQSLPGTGYKWHGEHGHDNEK
jgi:hypothetical protein